MGFRFFIQDRDGFSFRSLAKLSSDPSLSEDWRRGIRKVRSRVNDYLDSYRLPIRINGDEKPTKRKVMMVFIYGHIAHFDEKWRPIYERWRDSGILPAFENEFVSVMSQVLVDIAEAADLCRAELGLSG